MIIQGVVQGSAEWHAERLLGCGASETAALFDLHAPTYGRSRWALWMEKSGRMTFPDVDSERARMGLFFEPVILAYHAAEQGWDMLGPAYAIHDDDPQIRASLDGIIARPSAAVLEALPDAEGPGVVDAKMVDAIQAKRSWIFNPEKPQRPRPPARHVIQVQQQMACTGYSWGCLAVAIGGTNQQCYYLRRSARLIADIRDKVADFYASIAFGIEPPIDGGDVASAAVRREYAEEPQRAQLRLHKDPEFGRICEMRQSFGAQRKDADEQYSMWDNRLRRALGSYESAEDNDWLVTGKIGSDGKRRYYVYRKRAEG